MSKQNHKSIIAILVFCLIFLKSVSQNGWQYLLNAPVPTIGRFEDVYLINDSTGWAVDGDGEIFKTSDFGNSWSLQMDTTQYLRSIEFINDSIGFAGSLDSAVYKTTNAGTTWNRIDQNFPQAVPGICGISHNGNNILMVGQWSEPAYLLRSADGGLTWTFQDMSFIANTLVDCWYKTADTVFVSGESNINNAGLILRSSDGGLSWQQVTQPNIPAGCAWKMQFTSDSIGYASLWEYGVNITHILKTNDGGASFQLIIALNQNINVEGIGFINDSIGWMGGYSPGMYQTNDGGITWTFINIGDNINRYFILKENLGYAAGASIYKFTGLTTSINKPPMIKHVVHSLEVFPNPSSVQTNIRVIINKNTMTVLEIYNLNGKFLKQIFRGHLNKGTSNYLLDNKDFSSGEYIVVLRTNEHLIRKQFLIN